ncbi:unnamed protein product, partial [Polarella glacialis]
MSVQTNSIMAQLPSGVDLAAARGAFAHFGELHALKFVSGAFGSAGFVAGEQVGHRTVELAAEPKMKDLSRLSDVHTSPAGSSVLEFFDARDAARYRQAIPVVSASAWMEAGLRAKVGICFEPPP